MDGEIFGGRYKVERRIASGGMGVVCQAVHLVTKQKVALKVMSSSGGSEHEIELFLRRFEREARAVSGTSTEHIVKVIDADTDEDSGRPFIAMELLEGQDLRTLLKQVSLLTPVAALTIVGQACVGLASAHKAGVIHRDIKPGNIFLANGEAGKLVVKLIDFGVAKLAADLEGSASAELTRTGSILGTPIYLSPEQAEGRQSIDGRSDVWSLGVVLFKALTGSVPHDTGDGSIPRLVVAICTEPAPNVQDRAPWVSAEVAAIVRRALSIDRAKRYQSADEMLENIRALVPVDLPLTQEMLVAPSAEERRHAEARPREAMSRSRALGTVVVSAALAAIVGVAVLASGRKSEEKSANPPAPPATSVVPAVVPPSPPVPRAEPPLDAGPRAKTRARSPEPFPRPKPSASPPAELGPAEGFE